MTISYAKNKIHIMKWRANNMEKNRRNNKKSMIKYNCWIRISKEFRNILIVDLIN